MGTILRLISFFIFFLGFLQAVEINRINFNSDTTGTTFENFGGYLHDLPRDLDFKGIPTDEGIGKGGLTINNLYIEKLILNPGANSMVPLNIVDMSYETEQDALLTGFTFYFDTGEIIEETGGRVISFGEFTLSITKGLEYSLIGPDVNESFQRLPPNEHTETIEIYIGHSSVGKDSGSYTDPLTVLIGYIDFDPHHEFELSLPSHSETAELFIFAKENPIQFSFSAYNAQEETIVARPRYIGGYIDCETTFDPFNWKWKVKRYDVTASYEENRRALKIYEVLFAPWAPRAILHNEEDSIAGVLNPQELAGVFNYKWTNNNEIINFQDSGTAFELSPIDGRTGYTRVSVENDSQPKRTLSFDVVVADAELYTAYPLWAGSPAEVIFTDPFELEVIDDHPCLVDRKILPVFSVFDGSYIFPRRDGYTLEGKSVTVEESGIYEMIIEIGPKEVAREFLTAVEVVSVNPAVFPYNYRIRAKDLVIVTDPPGYERYLEIYGMVEPSGVDENGIKDYRSGNIMFLRPLAPSDSTFRFEVPQVTYGDYFDLSFEDELTFMPNETINFCVPFEYSEREGRNISVKVISENGLTEVFSDILIAPEKCFSFQVQQPGHYTLVAAWINGEVETIFYTKEITVLGFDIETSYFTQEDNGFGVPEGTALIKTLSNRGQFIHELFSVSGAGEAMTDLEKVVLDTFGVRGKFNYEKAGGEGEVTEGGFFELCDGEFLNLLITFEPVLGPKVDRMVVIENKNPGSQIKASSWMINDVVAFSQNKIIDTYSEINPSVYNGNNADLGVPGPGLRAYEIEFEVLATPCDDSTFKVTIGGVTGAIYRENKDGEFEKINEGTDISYEEALSLNLYKRYRFQFWEHGQLNVDIIKTNALEGTKTIRSLRAVSDGYTYLNLESVDVLNKRLNISYNAEAELTFPNTVVEFSRDGIDLGDLGLTMTPTASQLPLEVMVDDIKNYSVSVKLLVTLDGIPRVFKDAILESNPDDITYVVDLNVDSDNNGAITAIDDLKEDSKALPGHIIFQNIGDSDDDGIPDYSDGFNITLNDEDQSDVASVSFADMNLDVKEPIDLNVATMKFEYSGSDPARTDRDTYEPDSAGGLRIWVINGNEPRHKEPINIEKPGDEVGHYITLGRAFDVSKIITASDQRKKTLYVEGIAPGKYSIVVKIDPDGSGPLGFEAVDTVTVTVIGPLGLLAKEPGSSENAVIDDNKDDESPELKTISVSASETGVVNIKGMILPGNFTPAVLPEGWEVKKVSGSLPYASKDSLNGTVGREFGGNVLLKFKTGNTSKFHYEVLVNIVDVDIAVDGNRDGEIDFDDEEDNSLTFWVNNDRDVRYYDFKSLMYVLDDKEVDGNPDFSNSRITNLRDLEDFNRLQIKLPESIDDGETQIFIKSDSQASLKIYKAHDSGLGHVFTPSLASEYYNNRAIAHVPANGEAQIPKLNSDGSENFTFGEPSTFLFEGCTEGSGDLSLIIKRGTQEVARSSITLKLLNSDKFVHKFKTFGNNENDYEPMGSYEYEHSSDDYVLYVHGWNMPEWEKDRWGETIFKRLWWNGYKGQVGYFSWPTLVGGVTTYDPSDFQAYMSANSLRNLILNLNQSYNGKVRVMAHSMGNIPTSEALRSIENRVLHTYLAMQAAIPVRGFGENFGVIDTTITNSYYSPELHRHYPTGASAESPYFQGVKTSSGRMINMFNQDDIALIGYTVNNDSKGIRHLFYHYDGDVDVYNPANGDRYWWGLISPGDQLNLPANRYEIFAYITQTRGLPLGMRNGDGEFSDSVDLQQFGFNMRHYSHSRQFRSSISEERAVWQEIIDQLRITP